MGRDCFPSPMSRRNRTKFDFGACRIKGIWYATWSMPLRANPRPLASGYLWRPIYLLTGGSALRQTLAPLGPCLYPPPSLRPECLSGAFLSSPSGTRVRTALSHTQITHSSLGVCLRQIFGPRSVIGSPLPEPYPSLLQYSPGMLILH